MTTRKIGLKGKDIKTLSDCITEYIPRSTVEKYINNILFSINNMSFTK